jgi:hypothetical protein
MTISKDERATTSILRENSFPVAAVEGEYKGERRVFLCLMGRDKEGKLAIEAPLAMLLSEDDFKDIKNHEGTGLAQPSRIILAKG